MALTLLWGCRHGPKSKRTAGLSMRAGCYPCQTCLPQAQCTVSVGPCLVNCRLQIGQGLVITYVIFLPLTEAKSPVRYHARRLPENLRLCRPVAQDRSVPAHIAEKRRPCTTLPGPIAL